MYKNKKLLSALLLGFLIFNNPAFASEKTIKLKKAEKARIEQMENLEKPIELAPLELEETSHLIFGQCTSKQVYSPSNIPESKKSASSAIDVITSTDIRNQQAPDMRDLFNQVGGLTVQDQGSTGDKSKFRIRGTDRVLVLYDGMKIDDPFDNKFYLDNQLTDDIERIEVLKGPQGTVSGVQSTGGVVSINTRRGAGAPSLEFESGMGNNTTFKERLSVQGGDQSKDYFIGITRLDTSGGMQTASTDDKETAMETQPYRVILVKVSLMEKQKLEMYLNLLRQKKKSA